MNTIYPIFDDIREHRVRGRCIYPLNDLLIVALLTYMTGGEDYQGMAWFASERSEEFGLFADCGGRTPSPDTFERLMSAVEPTEIERCLLRCGRRFLDSLTEKQEVIDGKKLRGSNPKAPVTQGDYLLNAWVSENHLMVGQLPLNGKENEIPAIPRLLDKIDLTGSVVSIDAMGTQVDIAQKILDNGAHYFLAVKDNQGALREAVLDTIRYGRPFDISSEMEADHGRIETRNCRVLHADGMEDRTVFNRWPGLKTLVEISSEVIVGDRKTTTVRHYISDEDFPKAAYYAMLARGHWGIENQLYWHLDVTFKEDACRSRKGFSGQNLSMLRKLALQIAKATPDKVVDWGRVAITRGPYTRSVTIQNTGTEPLHISNITFDNEDFSVAEPQLTIAAGDSKSLPIAYAPVQYAWSLTAHMTIESDAINGKKEVTLTAIPYSVNELHLGEASGICDEIVEVPITVNNMEPLVGVQFDITLPDELKYVEGSFATAERTSALTATSAINGNKLTLILYSLTNATMEGNDGVIGTFKLRLNGRSNWYWLNPENVRLSNVKLENMTSATSGGYVKIQSPVYGGSTSLDMGKTSVTETAQATYSMRNDGNVPLTIEKVAFLADGFAVVEQLPMVIPAKETAALTVQFSPTVEGAYSTFMNVYTNDPDRRMVQVKVNGEIFEPNQLTLDGERDTNQKGYTLKVGMDNYTTDLVGMQFDVHWTNAMHYESVKASDRWNNEHITAIPINDNTLRVVAYTIPSTAISGNSGELMRLHFTCDDEAYEGTTVRIDSISLSNTKGEQKSSLQDLAMKIVKMGDVNDDGVIDVTDVTMLINRVLGTKSTNFHESVADMNGDTVLDVTDVTLLINKVLKGE